MVRIHRVFALMQVISFAGALALAQETPSGPGPVIRTETKLVLVDAVVTDKKGNYIHDLTQKDFKVWEDNKQQEITSFSFEADPALANKAQRRYMVLYFDNSTMDFGQQALARQAAAKFIAANAGPNRLMAIINYTGGLQITQNFTDDAQRLQQVVSGVKVSSVASNDTASSAGPSITAAEISFGMNSGILALKSLAKNLSSVPGRKSLILLTGGYRLTPENISDLTALVDVCNKANVAVYPIDVRGLVASLYPERPRFQLASFGGPSIAGMTSMAFFQHGGGAGGGGAGAGAGAGAGGGGRGGGTTGGSGAGAGSGGKGGSSGGTGTGSGGRGGSAGGGGGTTGVNNSNLNRINNPLMSSRNIMPTFPTSATDNQQPMYMLASGTGGFVIVNTNDLAGGLDKIGKEQNEYYLLGYTPEESKDGSCHSLKVKVERSGASVRARTGYCNVRSQDMLAGNPAEKDLEKIANGSAPGSIKAAMQAPFFYTSPTTARASVAIEIPTDSIKFDKHKGKFHGAVSVLGLAYKPDGSVGARFSDTVKLDFENKKELEAFQERPTVHYEKEFEAGLGSYTLKVVFNSGQGFGKLEMPLVIDNNDGKPFRMSGLVFSRDFHKISETDASLDSALVEDRTPLIANGMEFTPSGSMAFKKTEMVALYAQLYEGAMLGPNPPKELATAIQLRVLDAKTKQPKQDSGLLRTGNSLTAGNSVVSVALKVPVDKLEAGSYVVELTAQDTAGNKLKRMADIEVQ